MKSFTELCKNIGKTSSDFSKIKLAILGDSATQFLGQGIKGLGIDSKMEFEVYESDFGQIDQEIFNPSSGLFNFDPDFVLIFHDSNKLLQKFMDTPLDQRQQFGESHIQNLSKLYSTLKEKLSAKLLYFNLAEFRDGVFGNYSNKVEGSFLYQLRKINFNLMNLSSELKDLFIVDICSVCNQMGRDHFFNARLYYQASLTISLDGLPFVAQQTLDIIKALKGQIKKCLIFDLDNLCNQYKGSHDFNQIKQLMLQDYDSRGMIKSNPKRIAKASSTVGFLKYEEILWNSLGLKSNSAGTPNVSFNWKKITEVCSLPDL